MELWIRSQDRNILQKVNKLYVTTYAEENGYGIYDIQKVDDCDISLGFYKTKERALEALDAIQQAMIEQSAKNERSELIGGLMGGSIPKKDVFIQMPEE